MHMTSVYNIYDETSTVAMHAHKLLPVAKLWEPNNTVLTLIHMDRPHNSSRQVQVVQTSAK